MGGGVAGIALCHIVDSAQQTGLGMALGRCATCGGGDIVGVEDIMDGADAVVGMAIQAAGLKAISDHIGHRPTRRRGEVDVVGRIVAAGAGALGLMVIMQGNDVVHVGQRSVTVVATGAGLFLTQVGRLDRHAMGDVAAKSAVNVAIEIGRVTA